MRWSSPDLSSEAQYICGRDSLLLAAQEVDCAGMEGCPVPIWASIFVPIILGIVIPFWGVLLARLRRWVRTVLSCISDR
jgi:hypothetical protein